MLKYIKKLPEGGRAEEVSEVAKVFFERSKLGSEAVCPVFSLAMMMLIQGGQKHRVFLNREKCSNSQLPHHH